MRKVHTGFSLMEVVLAIAVLSIGLLSVAKLFAGSLNRTFENRDDIIAAGLAQEGIELIRNKRDNNALADPDAPFANISQTCNVSYDNLGCTSGSTGLVLNAGFYGRSSNAAKFHRIIRTSVSGETLTVTAYVSWDGQDPPTSESECVVSDTPTKERCAYAKTVLSSWQ
jgi:prepilin-type N-terminal cleavage/methylation domain-containing protein